MSKWIKILEETNLVDLSFSQRLWRSIALLRTGQIKQAESVYLEGSFQFKNSIKPILTYCEILLKLNKEERCAEILEERVKQAFSENIFKQWFFVAKRLKKPSLEIKKHLGVSESKEDSKSFSDWSKMIKLKKYNNYLSYLEYLKVSIQEKKKNEFIEELVVTMMSKFQMNSFQYYQVLQILLGKIGWEFLIIKVFRSVNYVNENKIILWKYWFRICPQEFIERLRGEMKKYLIQHPNLELETFLNQD